MHTLKLTQIGNSVGVILPKDALAKLKLQRANRCFSPSAPTASSSRPTTRRWTRS
jgi:hypothetical protein